MFLWNKLICLYHCKHPKILKAMKIAANPPAPPNKALLSNPHNPPSPQMLIL